MKRKPMRRSARAADSLARMQGQLSALIDDMAGVKARLDELESWRKSYERQSVRSDVVQEFADIRSRLDKLEVVRAPSVTTE